MRIGETLAEFISGPVLMTIGTRDAANRPMIARGTGGRAWEDRQGITLAISGWLWPETVANLRDNGMIGVTFVRADTYRAFQVKGRGAVRAPEAAERAAAARYVVAAGDALGALGVPPRLIAFWLTDRDLAMVDFAIDRVFEQTPGPRAGRALP